MMMENRDAPKNVISVLNFNCNELQVLQQIAVVKMQEIEDTYFPSNRLSWKQEMMRALMKVRVPWPKEKKVFGVPLTVVSQKTGMSLPYKIEQLLMWIWENGRHHVGIFRKSGVKLKIKHMKRLIEGDIQTDFEEFDAYDIADTVKLYYRELPEPILNNRLISIFQHVPEEERSKAVLYALLVMPNENSEALVSLLQIIKHVAKSSSANQMNENNLATCIAPSLFLGSRRSRSGPELLQELADVRAASDCLLYLLENYDDIYTVPNEVLQQCKMDATKEIVPVKLDDLGGDASSWMQYFDERQSELLEEAKKRGWIDVASLHRKIKLSYKIIPDGIAIPLWKASTEIKATIDEVMQRIIYDKPSWNKAIHFKSTIAMIDDTTDIVHYSCGKALHLQSENYCVFRTWKTRNPGMSVVFETSVSDYEEPNISNGVRGIVLVSMHIIEQLGSRKSKVTHLSRVETRGRKPEWYKKIYGHRCALNLSRLRSLFATEG